MCECWKCAGISMEQREGGPGAELDCMSMGQ